MSKKRTGKNSATQTKGKKPSIESKVEEKKSQVKLSETVSNSKTASTPLPQTKSVETTKKTEVKAKTFVKNWTMWQIVFFIGFIFFLAWADSYLNLERKVSDRFIAFNKVPEKKKTSCDSRNR